MSTAVARPQATAMSLAPSRLPYHPAVEKQFGIEPTTWRALVESIFPAAQSTEAVLLALSYCKARRLDPFKRTVHIVPIWDKQRRAMVETVWPGIAEYRTTAFRTKQYAGHDPVEFGPMVTQTFPDGDAEITVKFPEWAQMTVYRLVEGERCAFPGDRVYWLETYASKKTDAPNQMWADRPIGMIAKCAEAAALRAAFPEELGNEFTADEASGRLLHGRPAIDVQAQPTSRAEMVQRPAITAEPEQEQSQRTTPAPTTTETEDAGEPDEDPPVTGPAPEEATEPDPGPPDAEVIAQQFREMLEAADSLGEVLKIEASFAAHEKLDEDQIRALAEAANQRRAAIKGARGTASNGGKTQKPLV